MKQSESVKELLIALAKAQSKFSTLPKDKQGYGYKYTDIDTVINYVRPIIGVEGLGFMQSLSTVDGKPAITTRLFHISGEWLEDTTILPDVTLAKTNAAQNLGASITYMRRYFLCAMLGITSDEDVDGNLDTYNKQRNNDNSNGSNTKQSAPAQKVIEFTDEQKAEMKKWTDGTFTSDELAKFKKDCTTGDVSKLVSAMAEEYKKRKQPALSSEEEKKAEFIF